MKKNAFTIIELLAVIVLLGIITTISIVSISGIKENINNKMYEKKISFIEKAAVLYGESIRSDIINSSNKCNIDGADYLCTYIKVSKLVSEGYLDKDRDGCTNCVVDPRDDNNYLDDYYVAIYYKNKSLYAKFDISPILSLDIISTKGTGGLSSSLTGGMYRYQGAATSTINNYICIGSNTCSTSVMTSSSYDDNTYRIIGIAEDGRMKVIKMGLSSLGDYSSDTLLWYWNSTGSGTSYDWSNATIRTRLNNTSSGYFLNSLGTYASYIDTSNSRKFYSTATIGVSSPAYLSTSNTTATSLYNDEITKTLYSASTSGYKVGLMQLSDYYLATGDSANCSYEGGTYATCASSWINISKNDKRDSIEWTAARALSVSAWFVNSDGSVSYDDLSYIAGVRPVFYLKSNIQLSGSGTKEDPFYIMVETPTS